MKKILSIFDSLRPADLVTIACIGLIGFFLFLTITGCGDDTPKKPPEEQGDKETPVRTAMKKLAANFRCMNNLKEIKVALIEYEYKFKRLPDRGGDLFLAKLYFTGTITDWSVFICPTDAQKDGAAYVLADVRKKCPSPDGKWHEYTEYLEVDYDGGVQKSQYYLDVEREWKMSTDGPDNRTFKPGEISYAATWNRHGSEDDDYLESEGWKRSYERFSVSMRKRLPLVCDDFENADGEAEPMIHGDHVNVLYSNGVIDEVRDLKAIGIDTNIEAFKALRN